VEHLTTVSYYPIIIFMAQYELRKLTERYPSTAEKIADDVAKDTGAVVKAEGEVARFVGGILALEALAAYKFARRVAKQTKSNSLRLEVLTRNIKQKALTLSEHTRPEISFLDAFADTNLLTALTKGFGRGQVEAAKAGVVGAEGGALLGAILGTIIGPVGTGTGALVGAGVGGVIAGLTTELGVVKGFFDRIGAQLGKKGPLRRLGLEKVQSATLPPARA
jgi:hypothetical protein